MTRDFMIILNKKYSTKFLSKVIEENVLIEEKYHVSRNNRIIVAHKQGMLFDIECEIIKCRMFGKNEHKEKMLVESIIKQLGRDKIFLHFYGKENNLFPDLKTV